MTKMSAFVTSARAVCTVSELDPTDGDDYTVAMMKLRDDAAFELEDCIDDGTFPCGSYHCDDTCDSEYRRQCDAYAEWCRREVLSPDERAAEDAEVVAAAAAYFASLYAEEGVGNDEIPF